MNCCLQTVRSWHFYSKILHIGHQTKYSKNNCLRWFYVSRKFFNVQSSFRAAKPQQVTRYDRKANITFGAKQINLDLAKMLFYKDIGPSLKVDKKVVDNEDISWLLSDSTREVILRKLEDLEIPHIISLFQKVRLKRSSDHRTAFIIEESMVAHIQTFDIETCLNFSEIMLLSGFRGYKFLKTFFEHVSYNIERNDIEAKHIPRLMFFVFFHGSAPFLLLSKLEDKIYDYFESFSLKDLSVICLGYFRGHRRIHSYDLLDKIADKTMRDIHSIDEQQLTNILKAFRHSGYNKESFYSMLAERLSNKNVPIQIIKLNTIMHLLTTFASLKIYHKPLLEYLDKRACRILEEMHMSKQFPRTKEIAKITWAFGTFCFKPEKHKQLLDWFSTAFQYRMDKSLLNQYPESLADIVQGFVYMDVFPEDLIRHLLQPHMAEALRDHPTTEKIFQLLLADSTARIEGLNYSGPFLSQEFHESLRVKSGVFRELNFELSIRQGLSRILEILQEILGKEHVHCHFILPHMKTTDIEIHMDDKGFPIKFEPLDFRQILALSRPASESFSRLKLTDDLFKQLTVQDRSKRPEKTDKTEAVKRLAIEVIGRNQCAFKSNFLLGNFQTKLRQLEKLGYETWVIYPDENEKIELMTREEQCQYIKQKLCDVYGVSIPTSITK